MRLTIADLAIGKSYKLQVQADAENSTWSPTFVIPAKLEDNAPDNIIKNNIYVQPGTAGSGDSFIATWTYTPPQDFDHYEYQWLGSSNGSSYATSSTIFSSTSPSAILTYSQNVSLFGSAKPYVNIQVKAVNTSKISSITGSTGTTAGQNALPSGPTGLTATTAPDSIKLQWSAPSPDPLDLEYYRIDVSTTDSSTNGGFTTIATVKTPNTKYEYSSTYYSKPHWFRVYSVDKFGQISSSYAEITSGVKVSSPVVVNGLMSNITSYLRSTTGGTVSISTSTPHGLKVLDNIFVQGSSGGLYSGIDTEYGKPSTVLSVTGTTGLTTITSLIGPIVNVIAKSATVIGATGNGNTVTYSTTGSTFSTGNIITVKDVSPGQYNISNAVISSVSGSSFSILGSATGILTSTGSVVENIPAYIYPSDNATRVDDGGVTIGNMSSGLIVKISPTGFEMKSSSSGSRLSITSDKINTYKTISTFVDLASDGYVIDASPTSIDVDRAINLYTLGFSSLANEDNRQSFYLKKTDSSIYEITYAGISEDGFAFLECLRGTSSPAATLSAGDLIYKDLNTVNIDGSTGDATFVGTFSTGFSPDPRIEINSGFNDPESIVFYSGLQDESSPGYIKSSLISTIPSSFGTAGTASNLVTIPDYIYVTNTTGNVAMPLGNATVNVNSIDNFPTGNGQFDLFLSPSTFNGVPAWYSFIYSSATGSSGNYYFTGVTGGTSGFYYANNSPIGSSLYFTFNSGWTGSDLNSSGDVWVDKMGLITSVTGPFPLAYGTTGPTLNYFELGSYDAEGGSTLYVNSTTGFPSSGSLLAYSSVYPNSEPEFLTYSDISSATGASGPSFINVSGGGGTVGVGTVLLDVDSLSNITYGSYSMGGPEKTITSISAISSGIRTAAATSHSFNVGDRVSIYGFTSPNTAYNETAIITSVPTTGTFTYRSSVLSGTPSSHTGAKVRLFDSLRGVHIDNLNGLLDHKVNVSDRLYIFPNRSEMIVSSAAVDQTYVGQVDSGASPLSGSVSNSAANFLPSYIKLKGTTVYNKKIVTQPTAEFRGNLRLLTSGSASLTSSTHALQIGSTSSFNLIIDPNDIMARRNGSASPLNLNSQGGAVTINSSIAKGVIAGTGTTSGGGTATITHGLGGGVVPIVVCTVTAGAGSNNEYSIYVSSTTTTQFSVRSLKGNSAESVNFNWVAVAP